MVDSPKNLKHFRAEVCLYFSAGIGVPCLDTADGTSADGDGDHSVSVTTVSVLPGLHRAIWAKTTSATTHKFGRFPSHSTGEVGQLAAINVVVSLGIGQENSSSMGQLEM